MFITSVLEDEKLDLARSVKRLTSHDTVLSIDSS